MNLSSLRSPQTLVSICLALLCFLFFKKADVNSAWRTIATLMLGIAAVSAILRKDYLWERLSAESRLIIGSWSIVIIIALVASFLGRTAKTGTFPELLIDFLLPLLFPLAISLQTDRERTLKLILRALTAGACLAITLNAYQYFQEISRLGTFSRDIHLHRVYADRLVLGLPCFMYLAFSARSSLVRTLAWVLAGVVMTMIVLTGARGAWLGAAVALLSILLYLKQWKTLLALGAAASAIVLTLATIAPKEIVTDRINKGLDSSMRATGTWGPAIEMMLDHPLLGYGVGEQIYHNEFNRRSPSIRWSYEKSFGAHNFFLNFGFATGLIGLLALLSAMLISMYALLKYLWRGQDRPGSLEGIVLIASVVAIYWIGGMFENRTWNLLGIWLGATLCWLETYGRPVLDQSRKLSQAAATSSTLKSPT